MNLLNLLMNSLKTNKDMATLYIVGDSHVECFKYAAKRNPLDEELHILSSFMSPGKTAQGLHRERNQKHFMNRVASDLAKGKPDYIATSFGEIDCGFTLWSRMAKNGTSIAEEIEYAINGILLLAEQLEKYMKKKKQ